MNRTTYGNLVENAPQPITVTIHLHKAEGISAVADVTSFEAADKQLRAWAWTMPADRGGYDKTDYRVYFSNGDVYVGRFNLEPAHRHSASLKNDILGYCRFILKNPGYGNEDVAAAFIALVEPIS